MDMPNISSCPCGFVFNKTIAGRQRTLLLMPNILRPCLLHGDSGTLSHHGHCVRALELDHDTSVQRARTS